MGVIFSVISIGSSFIYENKYYLKVYLDNCVHKMTNYLDGNIFEG